MFSIPDTEKKIKSRISSYKSAMKKEKKLHGFISDGSGKRYLLFWLYLALNDMDKLAEYIDWYNEEFSDDIGEPGQILCCAVGLNRLNRASEAKKTLANLMTTNLYLIPQLLGESAKKIDIWHSSNYADISYFDELPEDLISLITDQDRTWIKECHDSFEFRRIRDRYIEIYRALDNERDLESRKKLLNESRSLLNNME